MQQHAFFGLLSAVIAAVLVVWTHHVHNVVLIQSMGRQQELNALDDYRAQRAGGEFGSSFGQTVVAHARDADSREHAMFPHRDDSAATSFLNSKFPKPIVERSYLNTIDALNKASLHDEESPIRKATKARKTGLEQMAIPLGEMPNTPKRATLQPKTTIAAADPFGGKALLKADPKHPGYVLLTKHALARKAAYADWVKQHPFEFTGTSTLARLDASRNPPATPHYDSGRYKLQQLGVRV